MVYSVLADAVALFHFAYVAYVVVGELVIVVGALLRQGWVRNPWFRWTHLLAIAIVVVEAFGHIECPVTGWERDLRKLAGQETSNETFVGRMVETVFMNNRWSPEVYEYLHIGFGVLVLATFVLVPPRFRRAPLTAERPSPAV
jgi:hypothetical protein